MRWDVDVINRLTTGEILSGLKKWLKRLQILNYAIKLYLKLQQAIYSMMSTRIKALKSSSLLNHSNEITVNQLITLLCGDNSVVKKRWYARKSWVIDGANVLIEEFSQFMNTSEFDKTVIASKQIFQKQANLRAVELELYIWKLSKIWGIADPEINMLLRFGLNPNSPNFSAVYDGWVKKQIRDINNSKSFLDKDKGKESKPVDYADFITDLLITINDNHFIDKTTITALDFYKMYAKFKAKQQQDGRLRNR